MRLSLAIQHHPRRAEILPRLISALTPLPPQVIRDPDPEGIANPWRTYRLALETTPEWATHRVVLQDDARPCRGFPDVLARAVSARPDDLLVLCVCGRPRNIALQLHRAHSDGKAWLPLRRFSWIPVIGVVWPARLIRPGLAWVDDQRWPREFMADDEIVGRLAKGLREEVWATVPSLVQHDDVVPSLIGKRARAGGDEGRTAALFLEDSTGVDWSV